MRRVVPVIVGVLVMGLACGGGAPVPEEQPHLEHPTDPAEEPTCPIGTTQSEQEQDAGLVLCEGKTGAVAYVRDGAIVLRGALGGKYGYDRIGHWVSLTPDGAIRAEGSFDDKGLPTGAWTFPDGKRTWTNGNWEPRSPLATLLWHGSLPSGDYRIELLDADLAKERMAVRRISTYDCANCEEPEEACNYPGLPSGLAGATLQLLQPGVADPLGSWDVYRRPGGRDGCSSEAEAGQVLAAAKEAIAAAGLDVKRRPALLPGIETQKTTGLGGGGWSFDVPGHKVTLAEIDRPGIDVELTVPELAERDWTYDSAGGDRTFFYELAVDDHPAWRFVFATFTGCAGGGSLRPEGLLVQDDLAALVLTGVWTSCDGAQYRTVVSPAFSLTAPKAPAF